MEPENRDKSVEERPQNKNLKRDAGPGRPKGQRNYATIYRAALEKLAELNDKSPEELEEEILSSGLLNARKGNYKFYADVLDRLYGKPAQKLEMDGKLSISVVLDELEKDDREQNRQETAGQELENQPPLQNQG